MEVNGVKIKEHERLDDLHRNGYKLIQNPEKFCFGVDAVLLSVFAQVKKGERSLDLCTGNGVIPILMEAKTFGSEFYGVEIQRESVDLAQRSVRLNNLEDKIKIFEFDIKEINENKLGGRFNVVTVNPPYMNSGGGLTNNLDSVTVARHEILCSLEDVISSASRMLTSGGRFYMIHRPQRLTDIFVNLRRYKLEPKVIRFVQPFEGKEPAMVLVEARRDGKPMLKVLPPLIIYKSIGEYTEEVYNMYYN